MGDRGPAAAREQTGAEKEQGGGSEDEPWGCQEHFMAASAVQKIEPGSSRPPLP